MKKYIGIILLTVFILPFGTSAYADVELNWRQKEYDPQKLHIAHILVSGEIKKGDYQRFEESIKKIYKAYSPKNNNHELLNFVIAVSSLGGDVFEAMKIGRLIRELRLDVWLGYYIPPYKCVSACVFILIAGIDKNAGGAVVGIHRPHFGKEYFSSLSSEAATAKYKKMMEQVRQYMLEMGAEQALIDEMFRIPSDQVKFLTLEEYLKWIDPRPIAYGEWLISKCGSYTDAEINDYINMLLMDDAGAPPRIPKGQEGYASYLKEKIPKVKNCVSSASMVEMFRVLIDRYPGMNKEVDGYREKRPSWPD